MTCWIKRFLYSFTQSSGVRTLFTVMFFNMLLNNVSLAQYQNRQLQFGQITNTEGLTHNTVYSITQDQQGFMWFGTRDGLNRFDGENLKQYYFKNENGTSPNNVVLKVHFGIDQVLYAGMGDGVKKYNPNLDLFEDIPLKSAGMGSIYDILVSSDSALWVCTHRGLFAKTHKTDSLTPIIPGIHLRSIIEYRKNIYCIASRSSLLMINQYGEVLKKYHKAVDERGREVLLENDVTTLYYSTDSVLWLGTERNGLFKYDSELDRFARVTILTNDNPMEANVIRAISEDEHGNIWIGTEIGLIIYNITNKSLNRYSRSYEQENQSLNDKAIYSIHRSKENIMWIGTYFGGINYSLTYSKGFYSLKAGRSTQSLSGNAISQITQASDNRIVICTEDGGVTFWDRKESDFYHLKYTGNTFGLNVNNVHAVAQDSTDNFWFGTFLGGVNKYDASTGKVAVITSEQSNISGNDMIYAVEIDSKNDIWIGSQVGLNKYDFNTKQYDLFGEGRLDKKFVYDVYEDSQGALWLAINREDSVFRISRDRKQTEAFGFQSSNDLSVGSSKGVLCVLEDRNGLFWFGTVNSGLVSFDYNSRSFHRYTTKDGLPNNNVYGILEDDSGFLWLSTNKGLSKFNPETNSFTNYNSADGLPQNQFNFKGYFKDRDGWMYFGSVEGLCYFHPDSLSQNTLRPKVYLSGLRLFNELVNPLTDSSMISSSINWAESVRLNYQHKVITLEFSAIDYTSKGSRQYQYFLEGFDNDWNFTSENSATYTNLEPGVYTFNVKAINSDGFSSEKTKRLEIIIQPPFWKTYWAYLIYVVAAVIILLILRRFQKERALQKMRMQLARVENEKIKELNQHKLNFFTFISHELKTPLTLIMAAIDSSAVQSTSDSILQKRLGLIKRNTKRLKFLIDQLMEFRRIETDHSSLKYSRGDIIAFLRETFESFKTLFEAKGLQYSFTTSRLESICYFDADKLQKIITNLISNAIKHTDRQGLIEIDITIHSKDDLHDEASIIIADSGKGMDQSELNKIFAPFYQTSKGRMIPEGSGIGLALVKSLVDFLGANIKVKSDLHRGTFVTVDLPLPLEGDGLDENHEALLSALSMEREWEFLLDDDSYSGSPDDVISEFELLIVEDNIEILNFLGEYFSDQYRISRARNGLEALEKLKQYLPDIIISDIMMPEMDGIELCQHVKSNIESSHIPIILLTAKDPYKTKIEALTVGADAYVSKPFDTAEISLKIRNLLDLRERFKKQFHKSGNIVLQKLKMSNRDEEFMIRLQRIVEEHMENSSFDISTFAQAAGVSRSLLHLKLKKLANLSASEFVKTIRLKKAANLLTQSDLNVSEVSYTVGYGDPNYFSRSFKDFYDFSPSEYRMKHQAQK